MCLLAEPVMSKPSIGRNPDDKETGNEDSYLIPSGSYLKLIWVFYFIETSYHWGVKLLLTDRIVL